MVKFNSKNKEVLTFGECLNPFASITSQLEMIAYYNDYIKYCERQLIKHPRNDNKTGKEIADINIGYYTGYFDSITAARIKSFLNIKHPILD